MQSSPWRRSSRAAAGSFDVTGRWESRYSFGGIEEIMIAEIEQIEESIIGSYAVEVAPSGEGTVV